MNTMRSIARFWTFLAALFFLLTGISILFGLSVPSVIMGILALVIGILLFFVS